MKIFLATIQDLLKFALEMIRSNHETVLVAPVLQLPRPTLPKMLPTVVLDKPDFDKKIAPREAKAVPFSGTVGLVVTDKARVWQRPVFTFDGEVWHLPYATKVELLGYEGRFAQIRKDNKRGFILKDDVTTEQNEVYPNFNIGEIYSANHPETKKLRRLTDDEFAGGELYLPLQDIEYVSYVISRKGLILPWGDTRPRLAGNWQNLLKGKTGIRVSVTPKTGSLFEYLRDDGTGFIGYIDEVLVNETIVFGGFGRLIAGEFRKETLSKSAWQEWRPVFIQIT